MWLKLQLIMNLSIKIAFSSFGSLPHPAEVLGCKNTEIAANLGAAIFAWSELLRRAQASGGLQPLS
jgi:hypothetical protein